MLAADIEARLNEWSRWSRVSHRRKRTGSAEGAWKSPQHWTEPTFAPYVMPPTDRVMAVERAVGLLIDPWRESVVPVYIEKVPEFFLRRQLRRRWRVNDPAPVPAEALHRVGVALMAPRYHNASPCPASIASR